MSDYMPDMNRVHVLAADCLRRWTRNLGPIDIGYYAEEDDWPELYGDAQLPTRHQHLFMAAIEHAARTAVASFTWPEAQDDGAPTRTDALVEQVVRAGSDPVALDAAVRELAAAIGILPADDERGYEDDADRVLTGYFDLPQATTTVEYETDATPQPRDGDHGTCARCAGEITYWTATAWNGVEEELLDAQWSHVLHPADGHDAVLGGPA